MRQGFTLIQISILLTIVSLVFVATLPSTRNGVNGNLATASKMNTILSALRQYETSNAALPCPADANLAISNPGYGIASAYTGTSSNCTGASTPKANYVDTANHIAIGMVPVRTLGLPNSYATDAFGQHITYAVDTNATTCFSGTLPGQIIVTDNNTLNNTVGALISHGADGHGAWVPLPGTGSGASRLNANSGDTDEHMVNAHGLSGGGFPANYTTLNSTVTSAEGTSTTFVRKQQTATFDDIVVYKSNLWSLNRLPAAYPAVAPTVTITPSSGNYVLNQVITVTATYSTTVTFTGGPPSISLTIGSNTRTAAYLSGNGTTALTFTYTLLPGDYAPSGITAVSPMNTNGATFTSGTGYCVTPSFTAPLTTTLTVSAPSGVGTDTSTICASSAYCLYMVDTNNSRLSKWNSATLTYAAQAGSAGSGSSNFANPAFITVGPSPNYYAYIADAGNNRIVRWTNTSATPSGATSFGSSGTTAGLFNSPIGIALDGTTNCNGSTACLWITDTGNNQVQRCSSNMGGGAANCSIVISGTVNGHALSTPTGITLDSTSSGCTSSPCLFIVDSGNNRILKFTTTAAGAATYASSFGSTGAAGTGGLFNNPIGIALDNSGLCTGSTNCLWIADSSNNQVQRCSENMSGGTTNCTIVGSYGSGTSPNFNNPSGIAWTGSGAGGGIGVIDDNNSRMLAITPAGGYAASMGTYGSGTGNFNF